MNRSISEDTLRQTPLFKNVESWIINEILEIGIPLELAVGKIFFEYGEAYQQRVFLFCEGDIEIRHHGIPTRHAIPGYILGLANYLDSSAYTSTAIAASAVKLIALPDSLLRHFESKSKIFFNSLNALVVSRIRKEANKRKVDSGPLSQPVRNIMKSPLLRAAQKARRLKMPSC